VEIPGADSVLILNQQRKYAATKVGGAVSFAIASSASHILQNHGKDHDPKRPREYELDQGSRRKLNFGLLAFTCIGLCGVPGEASLSYP